MEGFYGSVGSACKRASALGKLSKALLFVQLAFVPMLVSCGSEDRKPFVDEQQPVEERGGIPSPGRDELKRIATPTGEVEQLPATFFGISPRLDSLPPSFEQATEPHGLPHRLPDWLEGYQGGVDGIERHAESISPLLPTETKEAVTLGGINVNGIPSLGNTPPDPDGAIGPNHYVQIVNTRIAVLNKTTGAMLAGYPKNTNTLWSAATFADGTSTVGHPCRTSNSGDGIVLYDRSADRWLLSQFAPVNPNTWECVAVSTTSDPNGTYALYAFQYPGFFEDYPKLGAWPDAYYVTFNEFTFPGAFQRVLSCAYDRASMLAGLPARPQQCFGTTSAFFSMIPADLDGALLPPLGAPNPMVTLDPGSFPNVTNLALFRFHVDWGTPANSTFTGPTLVPVATVTTACTTVPSDPRQACIQQPAPGNRLESLTFHPMNRLNYRRFPDTPGLLGHESLVFTQSVLAGTSVGVRWYELRNATGTLPYGGAPTVFQEATWAPDGAFRWMGSAAMNKQGSIALGYSHTSPGPAPAASNPGIRVAGMIAGGTMGPEQTIFTGAGVQTGTLTTGATNGRWGDYTNVTVDPVDDCTFWYVNEYMPANGGLWNTRIANFSVGSCVAFPCSAAATAVTAGSGQIFSNAGSVIDSYRSSLGNYGGTNVSSKGNVQAGSTIVRNGGIIRGTLTPNTPAGLTPIPPPAGATNVGTVLINGGQTRTFTAGDYRATDLTLNGTLNITGGRVRIWVTGTLNLGGTANRNGIPQNLQFFYTGSNDVNANSGGFGIWALIYAPNARINLNKPIFGSVTGSTVALNGGGAVHFDLSSTGDTSTPAVPASCPSLPQGSCLSTSSQTVLVGGATGNEVAAYVPNGSWLETTTGVKVARLEGTGAPFAGFTIPTANPVNSCATNFTTGEVVCTANNTDVYHVRGAFPPSTVTTLTSGATGLQFFSGGTCQNCGVAVDGINNRAVIEVGLSAVPPGPGGFQFLNLASDTFVNPPIPAGSATSAEATSEDIAIDPSRGLVLSPNESNNYQLLNNDPASPVFNYRVSGWPGEFDSAAEDCSTGIAATTAEFSGGVFLVDVRQALTSGLDWSVLPTAQDPRIIPEFNFPAAGTSAIVIDSSGSHLGVVADEFGSTAFGAIRLPSNPNSATPLAMADWVAANLPTNDPSGQPWSSGLDPHTTTVYRSPVDGQVRAVLMNQSRTFLALVDLGQLLTAPRSGAHTVDPAVNLQTTGIPAILRYVALP